MICPCSAHLSHSPAAAQAALLPAAEHTSSQTTQSHAAPRAPGLASSAALCNTVPYVVSSTPDRAATVCRAADLRCACVSRQDQGQRQLMDPHTPVAAGAGEGLHIAVQAADVQLGLPVRDERLGGNDEHHPARMGSASALFAQTSSCSSECLQHLTSLLLSRPAMKAAHSRVLPRPMSSASTPPCWRLHSQRRPLS